MDGVDPNRTTAALLAGRVLDGGFPTVAHLRALRQLAARFDGLSVLLAGDEQYRGEPDDAPLHARVAVGVVVASVTADAPPRGPISGAAAREALDAVATVGELFWARVARELGGARGLSPARRRASLVDPSIRRGHLGVGFDGPDLARTADRLHLVASGPLAMAELVRGERGRPAPVGSDDALDLDGGRRHGAEDEVRGERLAVADIFGFATYALDPELFDSPQPSYLLAHYD